MIPAEHPFRRLARPLTPLATGRTPRLCPMPGIRAVVWDVYGTLVISASGDVGSADETARGGAIVEALRAVGLPAPADPQEAAIVLRQQILAAQQTRRALGAVKPEVDILEVWRAVRRELGFGEFESPASCVRLALEFEARANPTWPMPGAQRVVGQLASRGIAQGIVSNAQFFTLDLLEVCFGSALDRAGFARNLCLFSYRYGEAKPGACLFDALVAQLVRQGIPPAAALYVGNDMRNDVAAAARAGLRTALFAGEARSLRLRTDDSQVAGCQADLELTELSQLLDCLPSSA